MSERIRAGEVMVYGTVVAVLVFVAAGLFLAPPAPPAAKPRETPARPTVAVFSPASSPAPTAKPRPKTAYLVAVEAAWAADGQLDGYQRDDPVAFSHAERLWVVARDMRLLDGGGPGLIWGVNGNGGFAPRIMRCFAAFERADESYAAVVREYERGAP